MTRDQQRLVDYLAHILEAIERIERYTEDRGYGLGRDGRIAHASPHQTISGSHELAILCQPPSEAPRIKPQRVRDFQYVKVIKPSLTTLIARHIALASAQLLG